MKTLALVALLVLPILSIAAPPRAAIESLRTITWEPENFHGWPTVSARSDGELLLVYTSRKTHSDPFGRVEIMRSRNGGRDWTWPQVIYDGPLDDRGVGILETATGALLVPMFTGVPPVPPTRENAPRLSKGLPNAWENVIQPLAAGWEAAMARLTPDQQKEELGDWMMRSTDGGRTWGARYAVPLDTWHGPTRLRSGRLLYPGLTRYAAKPKLIVCESKDDGLTWSTLSDLPIPRDQPNAVFDGAHLVECGDGRIVCQIRRQADGDTVGEVWQTESRNGGKAWSPLRDLRIVGAPSHLCVLRDGRLLMTNGLRRAPFGTEARVSTDLGATWSAAMVLSNDGEFGDLGFPATVELADGTLVTIWYEVLPNTVRAQLRQVRWRIR